MPRRPVLHSLPGSNVLCPAGCPQEVTVVLESALDKVARVATGVQGAVTAAALKFRDQVGPGWHGTAWVQGSWQQLALDMQRNAAL